MMTGKTDAESWRGGEAAAQWLRLCELNKNEGRSWIMRMLAISCVIVASVCLSVVAARSDVDESLVVYLMFDEGQGGIVADASSYHNDGVIKGNPKWVAGQFGTALDLDGIGDTVEIAHADSLNITTAVTMEMWVKVATAGGDGNQAGIEKGLWEGGEYSLYPVYGGGTLAQFNDLPEGCDDEITGRNMRDNAWHHLAGVWDGDMIFLYMDGKVDRSSPCKGELATNQKNVYVGSRAGNQRFLIATVDEVRIYNRGLTEEEIQRDMETSGILAVSSSGALATRWGEVKRAY
jgi:hypothetical protein